MICKAITELNEYNALVIPVEEGKGILTELPVELNHAVSLAAEGFIGKKSESKVLTLPVAGKLVSVILIGLGDGSGHPKNRFTAFASAMQECKKVRAEKVTVLMDNAPNLTKCPNVKMKAVEAFHLANYSFNQFKSNPQESPVKEVSFLSNDAEAMSHAVWEGNICAEGTMKARDVVNTPSMAMTPEDLAKEARKAGAACGFNVRVLEKEEILAHKMGAFWAVGKGSAHEPRLIIMEYHGADPDEAAIALVGKGVMYDSGGYNLKSSLTYLYTDMAGGGAVLGAMIAIAKAKLKVNVYGIIPACENILSRDAYLPGDVVTAMNGKTVEVDNTDAEGRMVLADALTYAFRELKVSKAIDAATLTGAVTVALGTRTAAYMTNDDELRQLINTASRRSCEKMWELPLDEELRPSLNSHIADIKNSVGSSNMGGGSIVGGLFLQEFVDGKAWAHLDIAAVNRDLSGSQPHSAKGGSGFGASLMYHIVKQLQK